PGMVAPPGLEPPGHRATPQPFGHVPAPLGSQPIGVVDPPPPGQFPRAPGSGTGPSHPGMSQPHIPSTKHGYASGAGLSHGDIPSRQYDSMHGMGMGGELVVKPNRRPLIIGLVIVLLGVGAMLVVMFGGKDESPAPVDEPSTGPDKGAAGLDQPAG